MSKYLTLVLILATQDVFAHGELDSHTHFLGVHLPEILVLAVLSATALTMINKRRQAKKAR